MLTVRYTHGFKGDQVVAVNALSNLSRPTHEVQKATGTDDASLPCLALRVKNHPDLAKLIDAWPTLPQPLKEGIRAMVEAAIVTQK